MQPCPRCSRPGKKAFKWYCTSVHQKLDRKAKHQKLRLSCKGCGALVIRNPSAVAPSGNVFCPNCGKNKGELHPKWSEGQYVTRHGYRLILVDGRYQREHRVIWENANRASLLQGATIHHVDFDKLNNSPDNLLLFSSEEHGRFHRYADAGRFAEAADLLRSAAERQYHYPSGVLRFIAERLTKVNPPI